MNNVSLNEYILEGLGEIHALIAHEIMVHFKNRDEKYTFQRISNRSFKVYLQSKGQTTVHYNYALKRDVWVVQVNKTKVFIEKGRSKNVSQITEEIIEAVLS
tara:strand:- start:240 stop:545 length:306 start_codon:yes stop_codon:yes gene_type:complete